MLFLQREKWGLLFKTKIKNFIAKVVVIGNKSYVCGIF